MAISPSKTGRRHSFASTGVPVGQRLSIEIAKPKDWGAFQRNCVVLFREELRDPNAKEYGRNGQDQGGIDILGYRGGDPAHPVGIQCRLVTRSLKHAKILADCRAALALTFGVKEIIFATTAPADTKAEQAAKAVERELRAEGHDVTVHLYGWDQLQLLIGLHEPAYNAFVPSSVATTLPVQISDGGAMSVDGFIAHMADEFMRRGIVPTSPAPAAEAGPGSIGDEDPALHARIDLLRDLVREGQGAVAERRLLALRDGPEAADAPWARYRIETNIAAALMDRGRQAEAAEAYERAHLLRPDDPDALANLSIARTIQGRPDEGMKIALAVLARPYRTEFAVSALLQAASRSEWQGDPETLVPEDMRGTRSAELAVADFLRKRWLPGWEKRVLALEDGDSEFDDLARLKALAVLSIAVDSRVHVVGGGDAVTDLQIDEAATHMLAYAKHCLDVAYADPHDLMAHVSNAALLLRIANRRDEAEALLRDGLRAMPGEDQLMRLLAMTLIDRGRRDEAVEVLEPSSEPETVLMKVQFSRTGTPADRLAALQAMEDQGNERVSGMRRRLVAEMAIAAKDDAALRSVLDDMLARPEDVVAARLLELQASIRSGAAEEETRDRLIGIADDLGDDPEPIERMLVAEAMLENGLEARAADLIERLADLDSPRPVTFMYLTALAEARRDGAFRAALARAAATVREHPDMLWLDARHSWNVGDLDRCLADLDRMLEIRPGLPKAILMRIETLLRLGRSKAVLETLETPIEDLPWSGGSDPYRVARLLHHFGHHDRAARFAYRLFLQQRDRPRAWMTLTSMTIRKGPQDAGRPDNWFPDAVGTDVAIDIEYANGSTAFLVVEPDKELRALDPQSWEPEHPLVKAAWGLRVDDEFTAPDGRSARITKLRHKIVARFHYVLANYEERFPDVFGLRSMTVDPESPNGLDEVIAELKERRDWVLAEQERHLASGMPIDLLAARLHMDTIDVAAGLAEQGVPLKVAAGTEPEREAAQAAILANGRRGCVLDLLSFWTAWRLGVLNVVAEICGPIAVPRSVVDRLDARLDAQSLMADGSHSSLSYLEGGRILHTETPAERMKELRDDLFAALAWIGDNDASRPLVMGDDLPAAFRDLIQSGRTDMLDAVALALTSGTLLVCDDLALRGMHAAGGGKLSAWLHAVLSEASARGRIGSTDFTQHTVDMIRAGHTHLGISGGMIALGIEQDCLQSGRLGDRARALAGRLGGKEAEPLSHLQAACEAIGQLWSTGSVRTVREPATGLILERLIREREDWRRLIGVVEGFASNIPGLQEYIRGWSRGHFLPGYC
ncbi:tetratricopeptide repeat protein [Sphingomonas morindae]|uniref:PIN domain-containing protein n=1 Tax=Sphingomonas morindae TaxID=1541170 RepID=A0ABY4XAC8_9SPHN|nr:hypothetical protein [Sphingomonas morindae]USI73921.1 hypothetical protein LHA26_05485 [Sphingomonas morindae]